MPPKSSTIFWSTVPASPHRIFTVCRPGLPMCSVVLFTRQFRSTLSYQICAYSIDEVEGFITGPSSMQTPYWVSRFVASCPAYPRSALITKVGRT